MALYKPEVTQFLKESKTQKPGLEAQQRQGQPLLWDKDPIDLEERAHAKSARAAQRSYVYLLDQSADRLSARQAHRCMTTSTQDKLPLPVELPSVTPDQDSTPVQADGPVSARLHGEPLFKPPQGLYVSPDVLEVSLEAFGGPLDLLLYLIRRRDSNVLGIPLVQVARQYLAYIEQIHATNLGLAAEYLLMAAMFIKIRSRMPLPVKKAGSGDEPEDPYAGLVHRLLKYEQMKPVAQKLGTMPQLGHDFLRAQVYIEQSLAPRYPNVNSDDLRVAWADVLRCARLTQHHKISREELSVREHMSRILRRLQHARFIEFTGLFEEATQSGRGIPIVVVSSVAMFEFSCESLLEITQAKSYTPICMCFAYSST